MDEKNERKEGYWMDGLIDRLMKRKKDGWKER